jgi:hypothetical protein
MRAATDATAMIDFLAIASSLPNTILNLGKPDSFLRNECSHLGLNPVPLRSFDDPIAPPRGRQIVTLEDAGA